MNRINIALAGFTDADQVPKALEVNRYGCIVNTDGEGRLKFTFGLRKADNLV